MNLISYKFFDFGQVFASQFRNFGANVVIHRADLSDMQLLLNITRTELTIVGVWDLAVKITRGNESFSRKLVGVISTCCISLQQGYEDLPLAISGLQLIGPGIDSLAEQTQGSSIFWQPYEQLSARFDEIFAQYNSMDEALLECQVTINVLN